ncbi:MAG: MFS transporter [Candidatus Andeanibacterium colombiense]|uniref:MFS transporter n=1 Tax=Candidatus Andeanibacterium colombiense TaxID=3121345 RepID=A0AAJ5X3R4_9SPHN|nr:MAG: MFS transporter [Sphingomonadaceae bacterium]
MTAPGSPASAGPAGQHSLRYEVTVLLLLGLSFGFAYFDRMAMTFLAPFVIKDLSLNNTEVGALGAGLSLTWALGAYFVGRWSDSIGRRKPFLLAALVVFSFCSVLSGLAHSFGALFATRLVMGAAEGPFLPVCLAIMAAASADSRRGLNAGVMQNAFGSLIGTALAPIVLVWLAQAYGWRTAFYLAGIPGLILAFLIWRMIAEPPRAAGEKIKVEGLSPWAMLKHRNVLLCSIVSCFAVGSSVIGSIFMPLYLDGPLGIDPATWKWMMATVGLCPGVGAILITALSDRIGRKPPMIVGGLMMALGPLALLYSDGTPVLLTAAMFIGWMGMGIFPLFMGVVPAETLGAARAGTAMGLVVGIGEITGGVIGPLVAGKLADHFSLGTALWLQIVLALGGGLTALLLGETNPRVLARGAASA